MKQEPQKYCITKWGALLKVKSVQNGLVDVSDPDAIDAGMYISTDDVGMYWIGYRVKDQLPENGQAVSAITEGNAIVDETEFIGGRFQYDLQCEENAAIAGMGTPDRVVLWGKIDSSF